MVQYPATDLMTTDTAQTVTATKTFTAGQVIEIADAFGLIISTDGTATSSGAMVFHPGTLFNDQWFGIYNAQQALYLGMANGPNAPANVSAIFPTGVGAGIVGTAGGGALLTLYAFGGQGFGPGASAFVSFSNGAAATFNSWLDDNAGNMYIAGGLAVALKTVTGTYTVTVNDSTVLVNSAGAVTVTLLSAAACGTTQPPVKGDNGRMFTIKSIGAGAVTVATTGGQTIDGAATYSLGVQYKYVKVQSDGANWWVVGNN